MINMINPSRIFYWIEKLINFINSIFFIIFNSWFNLCFDISPPDYLQGDSVRIMYVHVPSAWIGLATFSCIAIISALLTFVFKLKNLILISKSIAPIGLLFTCLAIITGSLWGQPTWGTWWVWDARITSMLILAIFYILFICAHKFIDHEYKANKISSIIAIVGFINIPIIKYSVNWWNTFINLKVLICYQGSNSIHSSMMLPLMLMLLVLLLYCALIFLMKYKTEIIKIKKKNLKRL